MPRCMANNIEDTLLVRVSMSDIFALQLDESTDILKKGVMLCFVRFLWKDQILEDFLFSYELLHTTAADIFTALNDFFNKHDVTWTKCVSLSTDGAKSMAGHKAGLQARVKAVAPEVTWTHCCIHREALVAKTLPEPLHKILNEVVQIVNYIKTRPLQSRLFSLLCKEIGSEHEHLLIHTEFLESAEQSLPDPIKINAAEHLRSLATTFRIYFPEPDSDDGSIRNPFSCQAIEQIQGLTEE
ncbi:zinc finger BED domain-containing protein 5-like [Diabrotica undecimpunctata]|uniref:zinc finger BED domain-containing protein 5-like n=1 Tax=Diabrotica undecimpunctata TaxID=50387 RepID=UPI003B641DBD